MEQLIALLHKLLYKKDKNVRYRINQRKRNSIRQRKLRIKSPYTKYYRPENKKINLVIEKKHDNKKQDNNKQEISKPQKIQKSTSDIRRNILEMNNILQRKNMIEQLYINGVNNEIFFPPDYTKRDKNGTYKLNTISTEDKLSAIYADPVIGAYLNNQIENNSIDDIKSINGNTLFHHISDDLIHESYNYSKSKLVSSPIAGNDSPIAGNGLHQLVNDDGTLSNFDIEERMKPYTDKGFLGVFDPTKLRQILPFIKNNKSFSFIINTRPAIDNIVGHWVALQIILDSSKEHGPTLEYYDSMGIDPSPFLYRNIKNFINSIRRKYKITKKFQYKVNRVQDQSLLSSNCGWFAMDFLIDRYNNLPYKAATGYEFTSNTKGLIASRLTNVNKKEKEIAIMKKMYKKFGKI